MKLSDLGAPKMLLGFSQNQKDHEQWGFKSEGVVLSKDVKFDEVDNCID